MPTPIVKSKFYVNRIFLFISTIEKKMESTNKSIIIIFSFWASNLLQNLREPNTLIRSPTNMGAKGRKGTQEKVQPLKFYSGGG